MRKEAVVDVLQQILGLTIFIVIFLLLITFAFLLVASAFIAALWWIWTILTIVFFFFRNRRIGGWIFRKAWKLLVIAVILNVIGVILLISFPSLREYDNDDAIRNRIEREIDDTESSLTCKKAGSLVFDKDTTGLELDNYTYIQWNDDGTWRYAVLSPGTKVFEQKIYAGKATGYVGNDCNTAVVKQQVGNRHWASKSTIESFFEER